MSGLIDRRACTCDNLWLVHQLIQLWLQLELIKLSWNFLLLGVICTLKSLFVILPRLRSISFWMSSKPRAFSSKVVYLSQTHDAPSSSPTSVDSTLLRKLWAGKEIIPCKTYLLWRIGDAFAVTFHLIREENQFHFQSTQTTAIWRWVKHTP